MSSTVPRSTTHASVDEDEPKTDLNYIPANPNVSLPPRPFTGSHRRRFISTEAGQPGSAGLRRGRPNTLTSGLPSPFGCRSIDLGGGGAKDSSLMLTRGVIDTSPIERVPGKKYVLLSDIFQLSLFEYFSNCLHQCIYNINM